MHQLPKPLTAALCGSAAVLSLALGLPRLAPAAPASAETEQSIRELEQSIEEMGSQVLKASAAYDEAMAKVGSLESSMEENQQRIAEVEGQIPEQRERSAQAIRALYKMSRNGNGLIDLVLSAEDFNSLITAVNYLNIIQDKNSEEVDRLVALQDELHAAEADLETQKGEAEKERQAADDALKEAEELRQESIRKKARLEAELQAQREAEEAARRAEEERQKAAADQTAADQAAAENAAEETPTGTADKKALSDLAAKAGSAKQSSDEQSEKATAQPPGQSSTPANSERDAFVREWTRRIDNYLAGSPLAGYGYAFAEAAYDYGVDPRWSPAISCTESGKGSACFRPHNAWGWGNSSWPDWDTAIRSHVQGLSSGYGYTISEAAAQKYCPPTWQDWYSFTLSEMNKI